MAAYMGAVAVAAAGLVAVPTATVEVAAASASQFDPGNLISDQNFFQGEAMSATQVQSFLQLRRPTCTTGYTCLPQYRQATPAMPRTAYCDAMEGRSSETAASIIARVGAACDISQRVLLVLLEKEQSLVSDSSPTQRQYDRATGFACPDTAPCDPSFGGFFYQVYNAARQFQRYADHPGSYNHVAGRTNPVLYHPNAACGSSRVHIQNQATAGLYNYTPYQPNAAALANLYGTGDSCSAYGNRNFWRMFTDWFGDPRGAAPVDQSPFGALQVVQVGPESARLQGFAIDPSQGAAAVDLHLYVNGRWGGAFRADVPRPDIGAAYPSYGMGHGFDFTIPAVDSFDMCLYAINVGEGTNTELDCRRVEPPTGPAFGTIDSARADGRTAVIGGWALDPDTVAPVAIHAYVDGAWGGSYLADRQRPDVGRAHYGYGSQRGFELQVPIPVGTSEVCLFAIDVGGSPNPSLGCRTVSNASGPPFGNLESVSVASLGVASVSGWTIDPDRAAAIDVQVSVDGRVVARATANGQRADVGRAYPGYGSQHGFRVDVPVGGGRHTVCVTGLNLLGGTDASVGCRSIEMPSGSPFGSVDSVSVTANPFQGAVNGWVIDPDTGGSIDVHVYVNGAWAGSHRAGLERRDVGRTHPLHGAAHGFSIPVSLRGGSNEVCVYGINQGLGGNALIGCRSVAGPSGSPIGSLDSASASSGRAALAGWVIDPDTPASVEIHAYVNGRWGGAYTADRARPDVGRAYPGYGSAHGYAIDLAVGTGRHEVCLYGINVGTGGNSLIGCRVITS